MRSARSMDWTAAFPGRSLAVPSTLDERTELLNGLAQYFTAHADQENEPLGVTAAAAIALHVASLTAQSALNTCRRDLLQAKGVRDEAIATLQKAARRLILELYIVMEDDDRQRSSIGRMGSQRARGSLSRL
jgi:hypothetical protein